jgi:hypothetical protein
MLTVEAFYRPSKLLWHVDCRSILPSKRTAVASAVFTIVSYFKRLFKYENSEQEEQNDDDDDDDDDDDNDGDEC